MAHRHSISTLWWHGVGFGASVGVGYGLKQELTQVYWRSNSSLEVAVEATRNGLFGAMWGGTFGALFGATAPVSVPLFLASYGYARIKQADVEK